MTVEPPSTSEVSRRLDRIESLVKDLPNSATVAEMLRSRDVMLTTVTDDIRDLSKALAEERAAREQGDRDERDRRLAAFEALERKAQNTKLLAQGAMVGFGGILTTIVIQIIGGGR